MLDKDIEMYDCMKELLTEGSFKLRDDRINKLQCIDGKIRMMNIRNRDNSKINSSKHTNMFS